MRPLWVTVWAIYALMFAYLVVDMIGEGKLFLAAMNSVGVMVATLSIINDMRSKPNAVR